MPFSWMNIISPDGSLDISNFYQDDIQQIGFLKASKKNTPFQLEIKHIHLN